jgi:hypothetical protein
VNKFRWLAGMELNPGTRTLKPEKSHYRRIRPAFGYIDSGIRNARHCADAKGE